eukprot:2930590-Prorocentrum_lima.AAC.1
MRPGTCPCITPSRGAMSPIPYYVTRLHRFLTISEVARLQGWPRGSTHALLKAIRPPGPGRDKLKTKQMPRE